MVGHTNHITIGCIQAMLIICHVLRLLTNVQTGRSNLESMTDLLHNPYTDTRVDKSTLQSSHIFAISCYNSLAKKNSDFFFLETDRSTNVLGLPTFLKMQGTIPQYYTCIPPGYNPDHRHDL